MNEDRLRDLLRRVEPSDADGAERRARALVAREFESRRAVADRRRLRPLAIAAAAGALLVLGVLTPAGADVRDWIGDAFDSPPKPDRKALTELPSQGRLLVDSQAGPWVVEEDGSQRLLGNYRDASWSPRGLYVAAATENQLVALDPGGDVRWALTRPGPVRAPSWSPDGFRVAYRSGDELRVVAGDGSGDRVLARRVGPAKPAWRPGPRHLLAYVERTGGVKVLDADNGRLWMDVPRAGATGVGWSADGKHLLIVSPDFLSLAGARGATGFSLQAPRGSPIVAAQTGRSGPKVALVRQSGKGSVTRSELVLASPHRGGLRERVLFAGPGHLDGLAWSPDGRWLVVSWREADQWLFIRPDRPDSVIAVGNISRQFAPGSDERTSTPRPAGWCCPP